MKPLSNMQAAMDIVIVAIGLAIAAWIFSKSILNVVKASEIWVNIPRQPHCAPSAISKDEHEKMVALAKIVVQINH